MTYVTYVIRDTGSGRIKIGGSANVARRLCELQTGASHPLEVIGTLRVLEAQAQSDLAEWRVFGEWFLPEHEVCSYIVTHLSPLEPPRSAKRPQPRSLDDFREERSFSREPINIHEQLELAGLGLAPPIDLSWLPVEKRPRVTRTDEIEGEASA